MQANTFISDTSATTLQSLHDLSNSMFSVSASVRGLDLRISQATKSIAGLTAIHQSSSTGDNLNLWTC